jgi:hypothetical protein
VTSKAFLLRLAVLVIGIAALAVASNVAIDLYGLFRSGYGPNLKVYGEERNCKYLFSYRYIPENFDGLMLGSSVSDNIPTRRIAGLRIYNASLNGGDVTEAETLGINALNHGHYKLLILSLHRYLMRDAGQKTNFMMPARYWGALGSTQLYAASLNFLLDREGIKKTTPFDAYGAQSYGPSLPDIRSNVADFAAQLRAGHRDGWMFDIHPQALIDLQELVKIVHQHHVPLAVFYPPMPAALIDANEQQLANFKNAIQRAFTPEDLFIDFTAPEYRWYNEDFDNFHDGAHMSDSGAARLAGELDRVISAGFAGRLAATSFGQSLPERR